MTNHEIDNAPSGIGKSVLWQYDRAYNLLAVLLYLQQLYSAAVSRFWDFWIKNVLAISTCSDFGCAMWGLFLGVARPNMTVLVGGVESKRPLALSVYRKVLHAAFYIMKSNGSNVDLAKYIEIIFTPDGVGKQCGIKIIDNQDMSITYEPSSHYDEMDLDQKLLFEQNPSVIFPDGILPYPLGIKDNYPVERIVFGFNGQENTASMYSTFRPYKPGDVIGVVGSDGSKMNYVCLSVVTPNENTSWDVIKHKFKLSFDGDPFIGSFTASIPREIPGRYDRTSSYAVGDIVSVDVEDDLQSEPFSPLVFYICRKNRPEQIVAMSWETAKGEYFERIYIDKNNLPIRYYKPNTAYRIYDDEVVYAGHTYACVSNLTASVNTGWDVARSYFSKSYDSTIMSTVDKEFLR